MAKRIRRVNRRRRAIAAGLLFSALALPALVAAHPEWSPIRVNRYLKIGLAEPGTVRLVYTILHGDGPALPARKSVDLDANGRVDERERALLGGRAQQAVAAGLRLSLDGAPASLEPRAIDVGLAGDLVAPQPFSVDLVYVLPVGPGPHALTIDDRVEVPSEGDSEISIDELDGARLLAAFRGRGPGTATAPRVFTFRGPRFSVLEDRSVTVHFQQPPARSRAPRRALLGAVVLAIAAVAALAWRARRESRRRRA